jgi:ADP-ribose pyrophosphatase
MKWQSREWQIVDERQAGDYEVFSVRRIRSRSPRDGAEHTFHVLDLPSSVKVIALTPDDEVILVEQFRHAVERLTLEFPAGRIDDGEDAVRAALRELEEETGYRAEHAECVAELFVDPALQASTVSIIVARGCVRNGDRDLDDSEDVAVHVVARDAVVGLIERGEIRHAASLAAWLRFQMAEQRAVQSGS